MFSVENVSLVINITKFRKTFFTYKMNKKFLLNRRKISTVVFLIIIIVFTYKHLFDYGYLIFIKTLLHSHGQTVENYYSIRKDWPTSRLGDKLFKNVRITDINKTHNFKNYTVLIWRFWDRLKNRHIYNFREKRVDPLENCSVKNCEFKSADKYLLTADAVVIHIQKGEIPSVNRRNIKQRWIFLTDESPVNTFSWAKNIPRIEDFSNKFNWSMTYRTIADVPVPYGRTVPRKIALVYDMDAIPETHLLPLLVPNMNIKRKDGLVSLLMSNCNVKHRMIVLKELQKYINVDVYGACGSNGDLKKRCPGHFRKDCDVMSTYLFYLVLENSLCREYLTEKVFFHAYSKGAIPIIYGPSLKDCENLLPPNSFIHVDQFKSIKNLAEFIQTASQHPSILLKYHKWRNDFEVLNEHGYFGEHSFHFCRVCEALNYNDDTVSVYDEIRLKQFLDPKINCKKSILKS